MVGDKYLGVLDPGITSKIGHFGRFAGQRVERCLAPIACDGKRPLVRRWQHFANKNIRDRLPQLLERFASAYIDGSTSTTSTMTRPKAPFTPLE